MSTALAIAGVSAVLRDLLINGLIDQDLTPSLGDVTVSATAPDRVRQPDENGPSQLNLFMYRVTPNLGWSNVGYPTHGSAGARVSSSPLALDLHYLLTAFGAEDFHAEILLGYAMQLLHEHAVLSRDAIRTSLSPPTQAPGGGGLPDNLRVLATSNLADQVEQIKIVPEVLNTEEISKLWAAIQTNYRPTAAYHASVVLIEREVSTRRSLPVQRRAIHTRQLGRPTIDALEPQFLSPGESLTLHGVGLKATPAEVDFGGIAAPPDLLTDRRIEVTLPAGLRAGINTVQVVHDLDFGTPNEPHRGFRSNTAAFVLRPVITPGAPQNVVDLGNDFRSAELTVTFSPDVGKRQRATLLLNEAAPAAGQPARAYSFDAPLRNDPADPDASPTLTFVIPSVHIGSYFARVVVDGGESALDTDPVTLEPQGPLVVFA
jgi:hypothetical protein